MSDDCLYSRVGSSSNSRLVSDCAGGKGELGECSLFDSLIYQPLPRRLASIFGNPLKLPLSFIRRTVSPQRWPLALRAVRHAPTFHRRKVASVWWQDNSRTSKTGNWADSIPALTAKRHRRAYKVKLTIDPPSIAISSNVNLGVSLETVDIDGDIQPGGYLAIDGPDKLLAAHTAALEHAA
jgi:hypothetical protein